MASIVKGGAPMPAPPRRSSLLIRWRASSRGVVLLTAAFLAQVTSGCLSNEYRIDKDELRRLADADPVARGRHVRISQTLDERRDDAIDFSPPEREAPETSSNLSLNLNGGDGHATSGESHAPPSRAFSGAPQGGWRGPSSPAGAAPGGGGFHGATGAFHGAPSGAGFHGAPGGFHVPSSGGGSSGWGGGLNISGGGGKDLGAVLVVIAVVALVMATAAAVSLAASEAVRFDGHAEMAPEQLVYVRGPAGEEVVPLLQLTRRQVEAADSAIVKDDEGYGLRRLDHAPLDRKGGVFRFDLGAGMFTLGDARASGMSAHIQAGAYLTHTVGLVFDLGLAGGTAEPCCLSVVTPAGTLATATTLTRHSMGVEAQALPLGLGPLHVGGYAGGGLAIAGVGGAYENGPMANAGALLELDLTSHLAFAVRAGASHAWLPSGPSSAGTLTAGLSIY
jgi:hypothetical protein